VDKQKAVVYLADESVLGKHYCTDGSFATATVGVIY